MFYVSKIYLVNQAIHILKLRSEKRTNQMWRNRERCEGWKVWIRMHYKKPRKVWSVDNSLLLTYHITEIELYKEKEEIELYKERKNGSKKKLNCTRKNDSKVLQLLNTLITLLVNMLKAKNKQMIAFSLGISYSPHSYWFHGIFFEKIQLQLIIPRT